ncbi:hypothetical protein FRC06_009051, partial [Ceratobasidium sp. 370]
MSNNLTNPDSSSLPYYVARYQGRSAGIKRDADYQTTMKLVQRSIPSLRSANVQDIFISTTLAAYGDELVLISEEIWPEVVSHVRTVEVTLEESIPDDLAAAIAGNVAATPQNTASLVGHRFFAKAAPRLVVDNPVATSIAPGIISITVRTPSQRILNFDNLRASITIKDIKSLIEASYGIPAALQKLDLDGTKLTDARTLEMSGVVNSAVLDLSLSTRQTMIFLVAPRGKGVLKGVEVQLTLNRTWELAALYPSAEPWSREYIQSVSWIVDVAEDGKLVNSLPREELACLSWDGISNKSPTVLPPLASDQLAKQLSPTPDS